MQWLVFMVDCVVILGVVLCHYEIEHVSTCIMLKSQGCFAKTSSDGRRPNRPVDASNVYYEMLSIQVLKHVSAPVNICWRRESPFNGTRRRGNTASPQPNVLHGR